MKLLITIILMFSAISPVYSQFRFNLDQPSKLTKNHHINRLKDRPYLSHLSYSESDSSLKGDKSFLTKALAGYGMALVVAVGSGLVGGEIDKAINNSYDEFLGGTSGLAIGAVIGYVVGAAWGVYLVGDNEFISGSFGWTLLGATITAFPLLSPIGATIAFDLTSKPRNTAHNSSISTINKIDLIKVYF